MYRSIALSLLCVLAACSTQQQVMSPTPRAAMRMDAPVPDSITTPSRVNTRIGTLKFFDGFPDKETVTKLYDNLDFMRGVETFLNGIPAASLEAMRQAHEKIGAVGSHVVITEKLMDSMPLFLTGNTDTVYASVILDLKKDGPVVVEIPAGTGPGTVNDAFFRFVVDMGAPGPDRGKGGKYLILPPDFEGNIPKGYFSARSTSYTNWLILRGFLVDGKPDASVAMFRNGLKIYPYSKRNSPPKTTFQDLSGVPINSIHANNFEFYEELNDVIQREPVSMLDPELRGLFASIGIQKGVEFNPDERMKKILTEAAAVANGTARALAFSPRDEEAYFYGKESAWFTPFIGGNHEWLVDGGNGGRNLDARTFFFYVATVNTPAMVAKMVGKGSQYAGAARDKNGDYLEGSKTYKLTIPANAPAKDFWSVVVYDPQTRSELRSTQLFPSKNNERDDLMVNADGSVDLYFGPESPKGKEQNWVHTVPGKGWFAILRLYGPTEAWFDKTWRPGEFEPVG